ncbi:hypothetical protein FE257_005265 [Aspergillus nanangensis]|uniref:Integral membrane protein n=1 Tax=Aspergillus nanangensis TaxID=2582783 RepID=A0AAD4CRC7_ASPNN|nr:hypothetical protein FE257_005265 [Aspergillus nanangensis]
MDPIEPADGSPGPLHDQEPPSGPSMRARTSSQSRPQQTRPRAISLRTRRPTIHLQRLPSADKVPQVKDRGPQRPNAPNIPPTIPASPRPSQDLDDSWQGNRRRSNSEPRPGRWTAPSPAILSRITSGDQINSLVDESTTPASTPILAIPSNQPLAQSPPSEPQPMQRRGSRGLMRWTSSTTTNRFSRNRATISGGSPSPADLSHQYHPHIVDVLDVIDPEVSALSTLTNVQNSLFVPNLGPLINRNQTYTLSAPSDETTSTDEDEEESPGERKGRPPLERPLTSLSAVLQEQDPRFAVLPEGSNLEGWTSQDIEELNDHVRHMLHSRRSKFKQSMKGFKKYISKPLGFLITLYAFLITAFGLAWVLFLIGWINVGGRQLYIINVIDNVLVALFAVMGDGLAPFRAVDTYHMIFVAHYTFLTWKLRQKKGIPDLKDKNDLPSRREKDVDVELGDTPPDEEFEFSVLKPAQQQKLMHHQNKLSKSHTFYKPHETLTHHAFPLRMLVAVVLLLDCHSLLQIALGACTWGIDYRVRPFALTTVILCCSICCNISGGVLIMIGDRRTRKKDVVERLFREKLTRQAMKKINKKRHRKEKEEQDREEEHDPVRVSSSSSRPRLSLSTDVVR